LAQIKHSLDTIGSHAITRCPGCGQQVDLIPPRPKIDLPKKKEVEIPKTPIEIDWNEQVWDGPFIQLEDGAGKRFHPNEIRDAYNALAIENEKQKAQIQELEEQITHNLHKQNQYWGELLAEKRSLKTKTRN